MTDVNPYQAPDAELVTPTAETITLAGPLARSPGAGGSWISGAFSIFARSPWMWILLGVIYIGMTLIAFIVPFGNFAVALFTYVIFGGVMLGCRDLEEGKELKVEHLFACFSDKLNPLMICGAIMLGATLVLTVLMVVVGFASAGMMAVLSGSGDISADSALIPLLIFLIVLALMLPLVMMVWFAPALIVFHDTPAWDAMKLSFRGCLKNIIPFLIYGLLFLVLSVIAAIPLFLGYLVLIPVSLITMYTGYKSIYLEQGTDKSNPSGIERG